MLSYDSTNNPNQDPLSISLTGSPCTTSRHVETLCLQKNLKLPESIYAAIENEKSKLGQELHDGVNPLLTASLLYLKLLTPISKRGKKIKETIQLILMEAIGCIRNLTSDLVLTEQEQFTLKELVENYTVRLKSIVEFSITTDMDDTGSIQQLSHPINLALYRIIQEQINNIIKYSKASQVKIQLKKDSGGFHLLIQDDGVGFDTGLAKNGIGLLNMKRRIEELQGTIHIESSPGNGCTITIHLPLK